jgi:hypothetical protein
MAEHAPHGEGHEPTGTCAHCWHGRGGWTDTAGVHESRQCCRCGVFETVDISPKPWDPNGGTGGGTYQQPKHGPFHIPDVVRW